MAAADYYSQVYTMFVGYFGRPPAQAGLDHYAGVVDKAGGKLDAVLDDFHNALESKTLFANQSTEQQVNKIFQNLFGRDAAPTGLNYWTGKILSGEVALSQAAYAIAAGAQPADAAVLTAKIDTAKAWVASLDTTAEILTFSTDAGRAAAREFLSTVKTSTPATQAAVDAATKTMVDGGNTNPGQTFTLTTGTDTFAGTSGNDVFNASTGLSADGSTAIATTNALDKIDGGAGVDTLNIENTGSKNTLTGTITNVENLTFIGAGKVNNDADIDATPFSGTITVKQNVAADDLAVKVINVKGQTLALNTAADTTALTVALDAAQTSVTLSNTAAVGDATFSVAGTKLDTVNVTTDKTATGKILTVTDTANTTKTANITASGAASVVINSTVLETVKISGAGAVTLTAGTAPSKALDASASTGGVTYATDLVAQQFTGGAGKDVVQFAATTKAQTLGAGDDTATLSVAALGSGGSIDGGDGSDTIALTAANAATATSDATKGAAFAASVSNFEKFGVGLTAAAAVIDAQYIDGITHIVSAGTGATFGLTVNNLAANSTFETTAVQAAAVALNLKDSAGTSDVLNLKFSATDGFTNTAAITAAGVETLNIATLDTDTTAPTAAFVAPIVAAAVKTVVVSGNVGIDLSGGLAATTLTSFDASGVTATGAAGAVKLTTANLAGDATIKGGAGNDVLDAALAVTKTVTIDGGAGDDTITGSASKVNTLNGGDGIDNITGGSAADTINGGAGDDIIAGGAGLDILTGGAGKDTFTVVANTNGNIYATIKDAAAGDILNFADAGTETFAKTAVTLGATAVYQDFLNEAAKGDGSTHGAIAWFQFGGDTYVVEDKSLATSFVNNTDIVVKLTGLVDLTNAVVSDHILTLA